MTISEKMKTKIIESIEKNKIPSEQRQKYIQAIYLASKRGISNFSDAEKIASKIINNNPETEDTMTYEEFVEMMHQYEAEKASTENNGEEGNEGEEKGDAESEEFYGKFKDSMKRYEDEKKEADEEQTDNNEDDEAAKKKEKEEQDAKKKELTLPSSDSYSDGTVFVKKAGKLKVMNFADDSYFENSKRNSKDDKTSKQTKTKKQLIDNYRAVAKLSTQNKSDDEVEKLIEKYGWGK